MKRKNNFEMDFIEKPEKEKYHMLRVENIIKTYENKVILNNVSFALAEKEKKALIGVNGSGKTTLLKILAGIENVDSGKIDLGNQSIAYLPQEISIEDNQNQTIFEYLKKKSGVWNLEKEMRKLEEELNTEKKLKKYGDLQERYEILGGYDFNSKAERILSGFGLDNKTNTPINELSGGQKAKIVFAATLLREADVLLFDEPTNNLDLSSIIWLENFIKKSKQACLIVSHDRKFLDNVSSGVIQINEKEHNVLEESGNYSDFLIRREKESKRKKQEYENIQEKIIDLESTVRKKKQWADKGSRQSMKDNDKYSKGFFRDRSAKIGSGTKSTEKQIEKLKRKVEKPEEKNPLKINLENQEKITGNINFNNVKVGFENGFSLKPTSLQINYGEKIVIIGDNGSGKTTLLKALSNELKPISGDVVISKSLIIGNFMQNHENLPFDKSILKFFTENTDLKKEEIYRTLNEFKFSPETLQIQIKKLSPGERARLILAYFSAKKVNTLIFDEPTNHLDIESVEALEELIQEYTGTVILVSHDRYLLDKIKPDNLFLIEDKKVKQISNYDEYINKVTQKAKKLLN